MHSKWSNLILANMKITNIYCYKAESDCKDRSRVQFVLSRSEFGILLNTQTSVWKQTEDMQQLDFNKGRERETHKWNLTWAIEGESLVYTKERIKVFQNDSSHTKMKVSEREIGDLNLHATLRGLR